MQNKLPLNLKKKEFLVVNKDIKDKRVLRLTPTDKIREYVKLREDKDHFFY